MVLGLLWCSNANAETIKLNCKFKDVYAHMSSGTMERITPEYGEYRFWSQDAVVTINEKLKTFVDLKADVFNDEIIKIKFFDESKGPKGTVKHMKIWTLNRITGLLRKEVYSKFVGKDLEFGQNLDITYDCQKAEKKF